VPVLNNVRYASDSDRVWDTCRMLVPSAP